MHKTSEYKLFEYNLEKPNEISASYDFFDLPRELFFFIIKDKNDLTKLKQNDLIAFEEKFVGLNQKMDVILFNLKHFEYSKR